MAVVITVGIGVTPWIINIILFTGFPRLRNAQETNNTRTENPATIIKVNITLLISAFLSKLRITTAMNTTDPRAINLWIVKIVVFNGLPELLSQIPVIIAKRKGNSVPIIFDKMLIEPPRLINFNYFSSHIIISENFTSG